MEERFMNCAFEMGTRVVIYIRSLIKIGSEVQKLMKVVTQTQHGDLISIFVFFSK
jgi:hypothetical protein